MKRLRWQILIVIATLVVIAALLMTQETGLPQILTQPASGGVYSEALIGSISRLNPMLDVNNPADRDIDKLIFSGLVSFDSRGLPQPDLAESWGTSPDGTMYNFSIRPNALWHDGTPVTTDDVIFTIDLIRQGVTMFPLDIRDMWNKIETRRLNDKTLQFHLPEPFAPFLDYLTFGILPKHLLDNFSPADLANAEFNLQPVGTGPYQFERLIVENGQVAGLVLKPSENYYGKQPFIEQIIFRFYPSAQAALDAYLEGEVMAINHLTEDILFDALNQPQLLVYSGRLTEMSIVLFNLNNPELPFLQDPVIRRALLKGLNRQSIIDRIMQGQAIIADSPIFPGTWAYYDGIERVAYQPEDAISILKTAGYNVPSEGGQIRKKDNISLSFTLSHPDDELHTALAQEIKSYWETIGVGIELEALPYDTIVNDRLEKREFQAVLVDINLSRSPDPDPYPFWHQAEATGGQNYSQWNNRNASEYLEQARTTPDLATRTRLYRNFQVIFAKELPALPLFYPIYSFAVDVQVRGVQLAPMFDTSDRFSNISDWFLVTRRSIEQTPTPVLSP